MKKFIKLLTVLLILFCIFSFVISKFLDMNLSGAKGKSAAAVNLTELSKNVKKERENILVLGVDSLNKSDAFQNMRTDTMMLISVDPKTQTGYLLSIPRDSRVKLDGYRGHNKINEAHSRGGLNLTLKTTKSLLKVPINHYVKIDYTALFEIVNTIGGVDLYVPMNMNYIDDRATPPLKINLKEGYQTLDGAKSMEYLRFRSGYKDADLGRIKAQQVFMDALIRKMLTVESISKIPNYIEILHKYVDTDMSIKDMLNLSAKAILIKPYNIKKAMVPGVAKMVGDTSYYIVDEDKLKTTMDMLNSGNYFLEKDPEEDKIQLDKNSKKNAVAQSTICVLNGSGVQGAAIRVSDLLKINDILISKTGNADKFDYDETVVYYKKDKELAQKIQSILGAKKIENHQEPYENKTYEIMIVIGKDFNK